ncbi:MAG: flavodoxin FldA [Bacteroidales bacterium]|nr:flavodoxin FldA [Bacteroidales bacterium]
MKTIVYYGSTTGTCEDLANRISAALGGADVKNASELGGEAADYDLLVLGTSTWGDGEVQDDWFSALDTLKGLSLAGKKVAIFGVGDSESYPDTFCGGMKAIYDAAKEAGADVLPGVDASDYNYSSSAAVIDGKFVGLALDETNEPDKTDERIAAWVSKLK